MLIALVIGAAWGGWRLAAFGRKPRDRFLLRWCAGVTAVLALVAVPAPALLPVLHLWLVGVAAAALMLWVLGQGPVHLKGLDGRSQRLLLVEGLAVAVAVGLLLYVSSMF